uniref:SWIM-type domain-containing protein n=1 Tax=Lactuca sativa TaxID=4236 RepID=A0A9R1UFW6_LACSA|nr:hypothetical protein LSAT_V11C900500190 [Lactuca sativa]
MVENGVAECFNAMIKQIRKKPIITMLEEIRILFMKRFFHQGQEATKWRGNYGPNIQLKLNEFGKDMRLWRMVPSGGDVFETRYGYNGYKVDLANHTCTCNLWMLSGIPCVHSQAAINYNKQPIGGSNLWLMTEFIKPLPPLVRRMSGRPKVNRVKHASESEDAKYPSQRLKCQQLRHNKISCTNDEVPKPPVPKRKIGRPRKDGGGQPIIDQFPLVEPAIPRSDAAPPTVSQCGDQVGGPDVPRSDVTPPPVSESGNQVGGPNVSPLLDFARRIDSFNTTWSLYLTLLDFARRIDSFNPTWSLYLTLLDFARRIDSFNTTWSLYLTLLDFARRIGSFNATWSLCYIYF